MRKQSLLILILLLAVVPLWAQTGFNTTYAVLDINGGGNTFYDLQATTANPDFEGANLGTFTSGNSLVIKGAEHNVYKCGTCDIWQTQFWYRVYRTGTTPPAFTAVNVGFASGFANGCGGQDQMWANTAGTTNVLSGLTSYGCYTLEVYSTLDYQFCGSGQNFANNAGNNYKASFSYNSGALSGTYTVGAGKCFTTIASAVSALNANGISGPVTFNVDAGHTEALSGRIEMTATGTLANPIVFQKSGVGANPKLTAYTGTVATPSTIADGFWVLVGSDYITIDGIDLEESVANTTTTTVMEFGYGLFKASAADGCQNNTIKNCTITLNRLQNTGWAAPGHNGSCGIAVLNSLHTVAAALTVTAASGSNSNNQFYSNTIQNCNAGIVFVGFGATVGVGPSPDPATFLGDLNNDVGGTAAATGNTILNFGGAAAASNPATGIFANNQWGFNCSYNTLNNNNGSGVNHVSTLRGIFLNSSSTSANANCNNNNITLHSGATTSDLSFIENAFGGTPAGNTININNNTLTGSYLTATSGAMRGVYNNNVAPAILNIQNNTITNWSYSNAALTGSGLVYPIHHATGSNAASMFNVTGNTVSNIARTGITGGTTIGIFMATGVAGMQFNVNNNTVSNMSIDGAGTASTMYGIQLPTGTTVVNNNNVNNLACLKAAGSGVLYGIYNVASPPNETYNNNTIHTLTHNGTGTVYGLFANTTTGVRTVSGNTIYGLSTNGTLIAGMLMTSSVPTVFKNKIYNIQSNSTGAPTVSGIILSSSAGTPNEPKIYNNYIGNLSAPNASSTAATAPTLRGINLTTTTASTVAVDYNTIYLNGSSTGINFATAGIFHTSTTANLLMRNNLIVNTSTPAGTGNTVAFQRSTAGVTNFDALTNSNSLFAGTPSASRLIFFDGTNSDQTIGAYQTRVAPREATSISVNAVPLFISTTGSNANYLHITAGPSLGLESGGVPVTGITDDFDGNLRPGPAGSVNGGATAPDIGADEFDGIPLYTCATPTPGNTLSTANPVCLGQTITLSLQNATAGTGVTYQWQSSPNGFTWTDISGAVLSNYSITPASSGIYYRCAVTCGNGPVTTESNPIQINFTQNVASTTPAARCGTGTVTLQATSGTGGTLNWYANPSGGTPVGTGASYTTPTIAATTTYYVASEALGAPYTTGRLAGPTPPGTTATLQTYGHQITTPSGFMLNSVDVFSGTGTEVVINLYNAAGNTLLQTTGPVPTTVGVQNTIPVNFTIPSGTYRLNITMTGSFYRESSGTTYPVSLGIAGQIDGFFSSLTGSVSTTASYYYMYNLNVNSQCSSDRVPVTATVTPPPALTITNGATVCNGSINTLSVTSNIPDFDAYIWSPVTDLYTDALATTAYTGTSATTVYQKSTTPASVTYTLTATNSVSQCSNMTTATMLTLPASVTALATPGELCFSGTSTLTVSPASGYGAAGFQWESSPNNTTYTDVSGAIGLSYVTPTLTSTIFYRLTLKDEANNVCLSSSPDTVTVNAPTVIPVGDSRCGPGSVTLTASGSAATFNWYANPTGGAPLATGSTYSPTVSSTTNYYVSGSAGGGGAASVGPVSPAIGTQSSSNIAVTTQYMTFDVFAPMTIVSMNVYPTAAIGSTFNISIRNSSGIEIFLSPNFTTTVTGGSTPQTVTINAPMLPGTGYRIGLGTNPGMQRNTTGAVYPYTIPGIISLTGNSFDVNYYYFLYNIMVSSGCESPRQMVTATVETPATVSAGVSQTICANATATMNGSFGGKCLLSYLDNCRRW